MPSGTPMWQALQSTPIWDWIRTGKACPRVRLTNPNRGGVSVKTEPVPATTFDDALRDYRIPTCDFLKMDCEGAEYAILRSISSEGFSRIGRVSMETHDGRGQEAVSILKSHGFVILEFEDSEAGFIKAHNPHFNAR
jgi:hypothetical protein